MARANWNGALLAESDHKILADVHRASLTSEGILSR